MNSKKIFIGFLAFITVFVIPIALMYLILTEKVSMPPVGLFALKLYLVFVDVVLVLLVFAWIKR